MKTTRHIYSALTLIVFALLFWASATQKETPKVNNKSSQPVCEISDKTDEFTKSRNIESGPYQIFTEKIDLTKSTLSEFNYQENNAYKSTQLDFYISAVCRNGKKVIILNKMVKQVQNYLRSISAEYSPDAKVIFILSNGEPLTISAKYCKPELVSGWERQSIILGVLNLELKQFELNDSIWSKLRDFPPKKFRINYSDDFVIEEKYRGEIPFALKCIDDLNLPIK